jgi:hypothetical protein
LHRNVKENLLFLLLSLCVDRKASMAFFSIRRF